MSTIVINEKGQRVIQINTIMFSTKRRICFQGRMIIRHDADDKKYLYDLIDIKKET